MENKLKQFRELKSLSQQEVANKLYVSRQTVSNWENNHNMPPLTALRDLSILYNVSISQLIGEDLIIMKKKINFFALFGCLVFTAIFGLMIGIFLAGILVAGWIIAILFALAPILLLFATYLGQIFSLANLWISIGLMVIGVPLLWVMYKVSIYIFKIAFSYLKYSFGSVFYEVKAI